MQQVLGWGALACSIVFLWTPPHFWALALADPRACTRRRQRAVGSLAARSRSRCSWRQQRTSPSASLRASPARRSWVRSSPGDQLWRDVPAARCGCSTPGAALRSAGSRVRLSPGGQTARRGACWLLRVLHVGLAYLCCQLSPVEAAAEARQVMRAPWRPIHRFAHRHRGRDRALDKSQTSRCCARLRRSLDSIRPRSRAVAGVARCRTGRRWSRQGGGCWSRAACCRVLAVLADDLGDHGQGSRGRRSSATSGSTCLLAIDVDRRPSSSGTARRSTVQSGGVDRRVLERPTR